MAQDPSLSVDSVVRQYARFFFGADAEEDWSKVLVALEVNWQGDPGANNTAIPGTLALLESATAGGVHPTDWRTQMYLKRGLYDAYVQARYMHEVEGNEAAAYRAMATAPTDGSAAAIAAATTALRRNSTGTAAATAAKLRQRVVQLVADLNVSIGAKALGNQDPLLNMATIDTPLSDAAFLLAAFASIAVEPTEAIRVAALDKLVRWTDPGPGGFYDNLGGGSSNPAPRLDPGQRGETDPAYYYTPLSAGPTHHDASVRLSWATFAMSFFDATAVRLVSAVYDSMECCM
jgi:hypothetical protein